MSVLRFFAIVLIFGAVSIGWLVLGGTMWVRTERLDDRLSGEMQSLWGPKLLVQTAPYWTPTPRAPRDSADAQLPSASKIQCDVRHKHRYKGLLWYSTSTVDFDAEYTLSFNAEQPGTFVFPLPQGVNGYDNLTIAVNGADQEIPPSQIASGVLEVVLPVQGEAKVRVRYKTQGQDVWVYSPNGGGQAQADRERGDYLIPPGRLTNLSDFSLTVTTDFREIDYPRGTSSPTTKAKPTGTGMTAAWEYEKALTNKSMGIAMPKRPNAGPIAARMSLFAPVSLFFFFTVLFAVVVLKKIQLHPMHYLFIAAGFFAFHILLAYLVDKIPIHAAFWICAAVAVFLVVSYMRLVAGVKFAVAYVGAAQLVYLLGFSYAFFFPGWTGLTIVVGAVITLFVLMQATGRVDWSEVFRKPQLYPVMPGQGGLPTPLPLAPAPPIPPQPPNHQGQTDNAPANSQPPGESPR